MFRIIAVRLLPILAPLAQRPASAIDADLGDAAVGHRIRTRMVVDDVLQGLPESHRNIVEARIEGHEVAEIADSFSRLREKAVRPFPGAIETLRRLREFGIRLALLTNGHPSLQRRKVEAHGLGALL